MRRWALALAFRLTAGHPGAHPARGAAAAQGEARLSSLAPLTRTAGGPPSTSAPTTPAGLGGRRTPPSGWHRARPASGLTSRGLACPPHGGGGGGSPPSSSASPASTPAPDADPAAEAAYHAAADDALHALLDGLEAWVDDTPGLDDADVEYSVSEGRVGG